MYEEIHFKSVQSHLKPGDLTYDIGAYNGETSLLVAEAVGASSTVIIEPSEVNWPNIEERWQGAGLVGPRATFPGFLSDKDKDGSRLDVWVGQFPPESTARLPLDEEKLEFRWLNYCAEDPNVEARPRLTIDTLATITGPPRGFTMDVEGSELKVLHGARRVLAENRPLVWISIHPEFMLDRFGQTKEELLKYMWDLNYESQLLTKDHEEHFYFSPK